MEKGSADEPDPVAPTGVEHEQLKPVHEKPLFTDLDDETRRRKFWQELRDTGEWTEEQIQAVRYLLYHSRGDESDISSDIGYYFVYLSSDETMGVKDEVKRIAFEILGYDDERPWWERDEEGRFHFVRVRKTMNYLIAPEYEPQLRARKSDYAEIAKKALLHRGVIRES